MKQLKKSDLREKILSLLKNTSIHPDAAWVYEQLKKDFPRVAVGSVYRNLNILVSEGLVNSINFDEPVDRFDANMAKHYHFICEKCGAIHDLESPPDDRLEKIVMDETGFEVHNHRYDFYGLCSKCR